MHFHAKLRDSFSWGLRNIEVAWLILMPFNFLAKSIHRVIHLRSLSPRNSALYSHEVRTALSESSLQDAHFCWPNNLLYNTTTTGQSKAIVIVYKEIKASCQESGKLTHQTEGNLEVSLLAKMFLEKNTEATGVIKQRTYY